MEIAPAVTRPGPEQLTGGDGDLVRRRADGDLQIDPLVPGRVAPGLEVVQGRDGRTRRQAVLSPLARAGQLPAGLVADERRPGRHHDEAAVPHDGGADAPGREAARGVADLPAQSQRVARLERLVQHVDAVPEVVVDERGACRSPELDLTRFDLGRDGHVDGVDRPRRSVHQVKDAADAGLAPVGIELDV